MIYAKNVCKNLGKELKNFLYLIIKQMKIFCIIIINAISVKWNQFGDQDLRAVYVQIMIFVKVQFLRIYFNFIIL